jgi:signal transduction histidine kinase
MKDFWKGISIRYKIISIIILIVTVLTVTIIPVVAYLLKDALLKQQQGHLVSVKNLAIKLFEDYQSKVTNYTRLFSNDREIKDTLFYHTELAGEREHPLRAVTRLYKSFDVSSIEIGDALGRLVVAAEAPKKYGKDRSADPLIRNALSGKVTSGIEPTEKGFVIKASAPIYYNENQIIGTITSGILLDDSLLLKIKQLSNTEIVILDNKKRIVSATLSGLKQSADIDFKSNALDIAGIRYLPVEFPLSDVYGNTIGNVLILQRDILPEMISKVHLTIFVLLIGISSASIFVLFIILKKLTGPIIRLKEGAERIGKGEFGYRLDVASKDEIGELSEGFNKMAENLEKLRDMEEKLYRSERLASIGRFAAAVAHEINNPIGNIIGIARLMQKNISDKNLMEDIDTIIKDAGRCSKIVRDLLTYSRQSPPNKEMAPLDILIKDAINSVRNRLDSKDIDIRIELHPDVPDICIDPLQISQVLQNIILNSIQSIETSGTITIKTMPLDGRMVEIAVSDTGCGIDDDIKDKIFYPFFTTKAVGEGTGLGLAISYGIVQNHGGEIVVQSRKGLGSTFRVRLPMGDGNG